MVGEWQEDEVTEREQVGDDEETEHQWRARLRFGRRDWEGQRTLNVRAEDDPGAR